MKLDIPNIYLLAIKRESLIPSYYRDDPNQTTLIADGANTFNITELEQILELARQDIKNKKAEASTAH